MFGKTFTEYPYEEFAIDTAINTCYDFDFSNAEENVTSHESIRHHHTYTRSPTSQDLSSNNANNAFYVEDLFQNESSENYIDMAFNFDAEDYNTIFYFDDEPLNDEEKSSTLALKMPTIGKNMQKQDAHDKLNPKEEDRSFYKETNSKNVTNSSGNKVNVLCKKVSYVNPAQLQFSTPSSLEIELASESLSAQESDKGDYQSCSLLNTCLEQQGPKHSPSTTIISKVISIICDTYYIKRVQNAISLAMPNIVTLQALIPTKNLPEDFSAIALEDYIQTYGFFVMPNGYALWHFDQMQQVEGWIYTKNTRQSMDRLPLRLLNHKCNFYEPIVKRCRTEKERIVREALCPYCPVDFNDLSKCFFNTDGCSYQHHVSRNHGVWNRGYEMPPPLIFSRNLTEKDYIAICPMCEKHSGIFKLTKTKEHRPGKAVYNSFISYHKHLVTEHNIKKKSRTKQQEYMDRRWFIDGFEYSSLTFEE